MNHKQITRARDRLAQKLPPLNHILRGSLVQRLFAPVLQQALAYCPGPLVGMAVDDTRLRKSGRCIPQVAYHRDLLSLPFHTNLMLGLRFLQASLLVPLHSTQEMAARALPIRFEEVSVVKKPRKKADPAVWQQYRQDRKKYNLSRRFVKAMAELRHALDQAGGQDKTLVIAGDGSFSNRTVWTGIPQRVELIARTRKDAKLCFSAPQAGATSPGNRRFYDTTKFTPEQVRQNENISWQTTQIFYGGQRRTIRYKEVPHVLWQGGAQRRSLRLLVIAPTSYHKRRDGRPYYRQPAYLLTSMVCGHTSELLQIYFDRWQIEVNHREEKDTLGVGQAQMWNPVAVPKQPAMVVACYSALLLASLKAFGAQRGSAYASLPKWRRSAKRPSRLDLMTLLRKEMVEHPELFEGLHLLMTDQALTSAAAA
ncbi:MAG: transposase [Acidobacteriia bacterium]|nr:transposase [Terriglobia bacterium]